MTPTIFFDRVVVVESLDHQQETPTGKDLHASVLVPLAKVEPTLEVEYIRVLTPAGLHRALARVGDLAKRGHAPILHLEAHGDADGICLADGSHVPWEDLRGALTTINELTHMNLLVVMAMCSGAHLVKIVRPTLRAPAWGIIGPTERVNAEDLQGAMAAFYRELLKSQDGRAAVDAMNGSSVVSDWKFMFYSAELIFCWAFERYVKDSSAEEARQREDKLVARIGGKKKLDYAGIQVLREEIRGKIADHRSWYYRLRERFLMLDTLADQTDRFTLSYEQCLGRSSVDVA